MNDRSSGMNAYGYTLDMVDGSGMTAQLLCQSIAESAYKEAPELEKLMPKKTSKILNSGLHKQTKEPKIQGQHLNTGNYT